VTLWRRCKCEDSRSISRRSLTTAQSRVSTVHTTHSVTHLTSESVNNGSVLHFFLRLLSARSFFVVVALQLHFLFSPFIQLARFAFRFRIYNDRAAAARFSVYLQHSENSQACAGIFVIFFSFSRFLFLVNFKFNARFDKNL
jgi:hypothetical protein